MQRWYTCTPVAFGGGPDFFARDSGLTCRGLQAIGCESVAVMPGPPQPGDEKDLIRTDPANLESADWWRGHHLDGVVLYAWGSPRYKGIARAIKDAGIFLVLNQDSSGLISPLAGLSGWLAEQRAMSDGWLSFAKLVARGVAGLAVTDPPRAEHLKAGDVIASVSPASAEHYRKLCRFYGGKDLAERVEVVPHPVESRFRFDGPSSAKSRQVACVGRWADSRQKRPALMQSVLRHLAEADPAVTIEIAGKVTPGLQAWHDSLPAEIAARVRLRGMVDREELSAIFRSSRIFYSSSAFESFGIAAGEALCSGCSVVAADAPSMASFQWFVSENSGCLATTNDAAGHLGALRRELDSWDAGKRDPAAISRVWSSRLHEDRVASRMLELRERASSR